MFPFNTENRSYKVGFMDTVKNLVTNAIIPSQIKTTSLIADVDTFNPYSTLPYDIIVTRDLYPDIFLLDTHEHKINVRLLNSDNSSVYQSSFPSLLHLSLHLNYYPIYIQIGLLKHYVENMEMF